MYMPQRGLAVSKTAAQAPAKHCTGGYALKTAIRAICLFLEANCQKQQSFFIEK